MSEQNGSKNAEPKPADNAFGRHVKRLRTVRGLTQDELAERSGLASDTIRRLERAEFSPRLQTLRKLCAGLGLPVSALFVGFELPKPEPVLNDLVTLLQGCSADTLGVVMRVVTELLRHLDETDDKSRV